MSRRTKLFWPALVTPAVAMAAANEPAPVGASAAEPARDECDPLGRTDGARDGADLGEGEDLAHLDASEQTALRALAGAFLARKTISAAGGLELDEDIVAAIAVQACLPVLHLGLDMFDDFSEVIVYPGEFHVEREFIDADGVVHDVSGALSGEAMPGGPVVVSWEDVGLGADDARAAQDRPAYNVVIHEFAHKLDLAAGVVWNFNSPWTDFLDVRWAISPDQPAPQWIERFALPPDLPQDDARAVVSALERYFLQESPHPHAWVLAGRIEAVKARSATAGPDTISGGEGAGSTASVA